MFFYLHCGWGFNYLHGRQMKRRCLINWSFCGKPQNSFYQHKVPRHTLNVCISLFASRPPLNTRDVALSSVCGQASSYCDVSSLPMFLEAEAGLPTGMDGRGSCPARANISLIRVSRKSLFEIFFPPHEEKSM